MGRARLIAILTVAVSTLLAILYLIYQSKELEKYTTVPVDTNTAFIIYSSEGEALKDNTSAASLLEACERSLKAMGYETIRLEQIGNPEEIKKEITKSIRGSRKYIVLDINASQSVASKDTLLIRISNKIKSRHEENLRAANDVRDFLKNRKTKVNIYTDTKLTLNQDMGTTALTLEISKQNTLKEAREIILNAAYALTK
jgi:hypothetical protein